VALPSPPARREARSTGHEERGSDRVRRRGGPILLAALLFLGGVAGAAAPAQAVPHPGGLGLALTANPTNGSAPLVVAFHAALTPNTTLAWFNWSFGDGDSYNQSATGSSSPAHEYVSVGVYDATVSVTSTSGDANASLVVTVVAENLVASFQATPLSGTAPLTVHFLAVVSGGTGTYQSILWSFGDGDSGSGPDINYAYPIAGTFDVDLTVTDSSGHSVRDEGTIRVDSGGGSGPNTTTPNALVQAVPYVLATAAILAAAAIAGLAYRGMVRRRAAAIEAPPGAMAGTAAVADLAGSPPPGLPETGASGAPAERPGPAGVGASLDESRRLSERILIHLLWYGRRGDEGAARFEASQQGMARALGSGQNTISKALSRLIDAGAVRVEVQHVPGAPRRVKTYSLTSRGEAVARSLTRGPGDTRRGPGGSS
jgi:hypothetical protein